MKERWQYFSTIVPSVLIQLTPKIIDQLNEVVIKHASYIFFFSKRWSTGGPSWEFFFVNTLIISKKIRRVFIKKLNRYSVVVSEIQTKVFQTDPSYRKLTREEVVFVQFICLLVYCNLTDRFFTKKKKLRVANLEKSLLFIRI